MRGSLVEKIDALLLDRRAQRNAERVEKYGTTRDGFFASEIGGCYRKVAYDFNGFPKQDLSTRTLRILENGEVLQARYSDYFKELGVWVDEEHSVNTNDRDDTPWVLFGRTDIIVNAAMLFDDNAEWCIPLRTATEAEETANRYILGEDGRPYILDWAALNANEELKKDLAIIEMKSINTWGFKEIAKSMQPEPAHYLQLQTYLWLTGIHEGYIIYEDKNDQTICEIPVTYDERVIYGTSDGRTKGLIVELSELGAMIDEGTVPARCPEAKENNFPCKWKTGQCDYYDYCWNPEHHGDKLPSQLVAPREIVAIGELSFYKDEVLEVMTAEELTQLQNLAIKFGSSVIPKIIAKAAIPADQLPAVSAAAEAAPAAESPAAPVTEASVVTATLATTPAAAAPIVTATPAAAPAKPSLLSVKNRQAKKDATLTPPPSEVGGTGAVKTVADVRQTQDAAVAAGAQLKQQQQDTAEQNAADGFATEFLNEQGERAIYCIKCGKEITYMRLANGNTIKCTNRKCQHVNKVKKS